MYQTLDWVIFYISFSLSGHSELGSIMSISIDKEAETVKTPQKSCTRTWGLYKWIQMSPADFRTHSFLTATKPRTLFYFLLNLHGTNLLLAHGTCLINQRTIICQSLTGS